MLETVQATRRTAGAILLAALLPGVPASAQDARYDIPYRTTVAHPQVYRAADVDVARIPRVVVDRPAPRHQRLPIPEGTGGLPQPASAPVRFVGHPSTGTEPQSSPGDFRIWSSNSIVQPGLTVNWPPEPQAVIERDSVLYTHNSGAAVSGDAGGTWSRIAPETLFPASDGGFCCDQRLVRSHANPTLTFWLLQYWYSGTTQTGRHRIAVARTRDDIKNSSYYFYDLTPQMFGYAAGLWFDFPDLACSHTHLYGSANVYRGSDNANMGSVLWRINLAQLNAGGNVGIGFYTRNEIGGELYRLTQLATDTMYAATDWNTTTLRFYWWPDSGNLSFENKTVAAFSTATVSAPGPDGRDWAGFCDHRILGAYLALGEVGFLHSSAPLAGRPRGFVRASVFSGFSRALLREQDIWSNDFAILYPAVSRNGRGDKAVVMAIGGGSYHPSTVGMLVDIYSPNFDGNSFYYLSQGTSGPGSNRWGDYIGVTLNPQYLETFVAPAHSQTGPASWQIDHRYVWFSRERDIPYWIDVNVAATDAAGTTAIAPTIDVAQADRYLRRAGTTPFTRSYTIRQAVTLTAPPTFTDGAGTPYRFLRWVGPGGNQPIGQRTLHVDDIGTFTAISVSARYERLRFVDVNSFPITGVPVVIDVPDANGQSGGTTPFRRTYVEGTRLTLTAPSQVGTRFFGYWTRSGTRLPTGRNTLVLDADAHYTATADYGGTVGNGPEWKDLTALSAQPPTRLFHGLAYDEASTRVVLFGGAGSGGALGDTWELDGDVWTQQAPTNSPAARQGHAMAYDRNLQRVLLFGGGPGATAQRTDETWAWDGVDWTQLTPAVSPPRRANAVMCWDGTSGRMLLHGGIDATGLFGARLNDTWAFDGTTWTQLAPATVPPGFDYRSMSWDEARGRALLLGYLAGAASSYLFAWDGIDWTDVTPASLPQRRSSTLAYDVLRSRTVLFSGRTAIGTASADTWEFDGTTFRERVTPLVPPARYDHVFVHDTARKRCVLVGGFQAPFTTLRDTWQYHYPCDVVGEGHAGGGLSLVCTAPPQIGQTFCAEFPSALGSGFAVFGFGGPVPPLQIDPPIACTTGLLHASPDVVLSAPGMPASVCVTIPSDPSLVHAALTLQGLDLTAGSCFEFTDAVVIVIQP